MKDNTLKLVIVAILGVCAMAAVGSICFAAVTGKPIDVVASTLATGITTLLGNLLGRTSAPPPGDGTNRT